MFIFHFYVGQLQPNGLMRVHLGRDFHKQFPQLSLSVSLYIWTRLYVVNQI